MGLSMCKSMCGGHREACRVSCGGLVAPSDN